jgi:hypothetical protein
MSNKLLSKYTGRAAESAAPAAHAATDAEVIDDFGAFGWMRGARDRAVMLELEKRDGNIVAFG